MYRNVQASNFHVLGHQNAVGGEYGDARIKSNYSSQNDPYSEVKNYSSRMNDDTQADRSNRLTFKSDPRFEPNLESLGFDSYQDYESQNHWTEGHEIDDGDLIPDERDNDDEDLDLDLFSNAQQSSAPGKSKYKLMYIPSILAKRHLIRKLARFGKLSYFEFIPGEFSNKISPEVLLQSKTKFQDFKGAEFMFELEYSEKLFAGVKRLRVKGLQIKVIPPVPAKVEIIPLENANSLNSGISKKGAQPIEFDQKYLPVQKKAEILPKKDGSLNQSKKPEFEWSGEPQSEQCLYLGAFKIRPTQRAYYGLSRPDLSSHLGRPLLLLGPGSGWPSEGPAASHVGDANYRLNLSEPKHLASFLSKYQQARKPKAVIMVKSALQMQNIRN